MTAFEAAIEVVFVNEGGYSDDPADRGGKTNFGITQETLDRARQEWGHAAPSIPASVVDLTRAEAGRIYQELYWREPGIHELPPALAVCVFDHAVNAGPPKAVRLLQRALGTKVDGVIGPKTLTAARRAGNEGPILFSAERMAHYAGIATRTPSQRRFLRGWRIRAFRTLLAAAQHMES